MFPFVQLAVDYDDDDVLTLLIQEDTAQDTVKVNGTKCRRKWLATQTMVDELIDRTSPISVDSGKINGNYIKSETFLFVVGSNVE